MIKKYRCYSIVIILMIALACHSRLPLQKKAIIPNQDAHMIEQDTSLWNYIGKHQWRLLQWEGKIQHNSPIYLNFDVTKLQFSGNAGCNHIFGSYHTYDDQLFFEKVASTEMACLNDSITTHEHQFIMLLNASPFRFDVADQTLNFYQKDKLILMFGRTDKEEK